MCKCIQSCFESCYWHCIEKWLCYDDTIASYEDPVPQEKDPRAYDNMAFWDSVAVIANRSIVTVQPLPEDSKPVEVTRQQPNHETSPPNTLKPVQNELNTSTDTEDSSSRPNIIVNSPDSEKSKLRKKSAIEEKIEKSSETFSQERNRKKSLKDRRKSAAGLTLKLENDFHEIPVIRQSSMPKFYLDTPELGSNPHGTYNSDRSSVLVSPVLPNSPTFNYDLRSVVQMEKEQHATRSKPATPRSNRSSRLTHVRKKLRPMLSKKASSKSLPDGINHV